MPRCSPCKGHARAGPASAASAVGLPCGLRLALADLGRSEPYDISLMEYQLRLCLFAAWILLASAFAAPARALDSKEIYQLNEDRVFQVRVLNRETGKK